ncbi:MAG: KilA-N domain-containing protein [Veillonella parvula]
MKSNQEMVRKIENFTVTQRTSDGFFDGSELLRQWNAVDGNARRRMNEFLGSPKVKDFINALADDESHRRKTDNGDNQQVTEVDLIKHVKGRISKNGRTPDKVWMNPILFIKFAMWINPTFEVKVIRFVYDEMIKYRNDAGDAYREMSSAVGKIVPADFMPKAMQKIAEALNWIVFGNHEKMARNKYGDENKQRELYQLEKKIADLVNDGFIKSYDSLINYLRKKYQEVQYPKVFRTA